MATIARILFFVLLVAYSLVFVDLKYSGKVKNFRYFIIYYGSIFQEYGSVIPVMSFLPPELHSVHGYRAQWSL